MKHTLLIAAVLSLAAPVFAADSATAKTADTYPLKTCVVSGEELGSMGDAYVVTHKEDGKPDREVRLCCKGCLKKFNKAPAKYLEKLDSAKSDAAKASAPTADAHAGHNH